MGLPETTRKFLKLAIKNKKYNEYAFTNDNH